MHLRNNKIIAMEQQDDIAPSVHVENRDAANSNMNMDNSESYELLVAAVMKLKAQVDSLNTNLQSQNDDIIEELRKINDDMIEEIRKNNDDMKKEIGKINDNMKKITERDDNLHNKIESCINNRFQCRESSINDKLESLEHSMQEFGKGIRNDINDSMQGEIDRPQKNDSTQDMIQGEQQGNNVIETDSPSKSTALDNELRGKGESMACHHEVESSSNLPPNDVADKVPERDSFPDKVMGEEQVDNVIESSSSNKLSLSEHEQEIEAGASNHGHEYSTNHPQFDSNPDKHGVAK